MASVNHAFSNSADILARMDGITIREATATDLARIAELVAGDPGDEAIGLLGSREKARRFGLAMATLDTHPPQWRDTLLAEREATIVAVLQVGARAEDIRITPRVVWLAVRTLGPIDVLFRQGRLAARRRVQPEIPPAAYHIAEFNVDPEYRGQGIGGVLLDHAAAQARERGHAQMSLVTTTSNPARRLYERHGFRVADIRTDAEYEELTGIEGRILMLKDLD
jgi:ribosomal protein S18 acetylase RimI-like enzyme